MRTRRILGTSIVVGALVATSFQAGPASASGGGGCGGPVTDDRGDLVVIKAFCFTPTILRVHPGTEVTFRNLDGRKYGVSHNVLGSNASWGSFQSLNKRNPSVTYRFTEKGIYPFACVIHPGMIGAVVVGGGPPMESGTVTTAEGPVVKVDPSELEPAAVVAAPELVTSPEANGDAMPAIAIALVAMASLGFVVRSRRSVRLAAL